MTTHEITWKYILNQLVKHQNLTDTEVAWAMDQHHDRPNRTADPRDPSSPPSTQRQTPKNSAPSQPALIAKAETVDIDPTP